MNIVFVGFLFPFLCSSRMATRHEAEVLEFLIPVFFRLTRTECERLHAILFFFEFGIHRHASWDSAHIFHAALLHYVLFAFSICRFPTDWTFFVLLTVAHDNDFQFCSAFGTSAHGVEWISVLSMAFLAAELLCTSLRASWLCDTVVNMNLLWLRSTLKAKCKCHVS